MKHQKVLIRTIQSKRVHLQNNELKCTLNQNFSGYLFKYSNDILIIFHF
jgi:hypothetical protein